MEEQVAAGMRPEDQSVAAAMARASRQQWRVVFLWARVAMTKEEILQ